MLFLLLACADADPEGTDPATCADGVDNDADGEIDCDDAGCADVEGCEASGDVVINEFMAANQSTIERDDGLYEDWIELYNAGDDAVDVGGWTITDDLSLPQKHTLASVVLEPGELLFLWADDDEEEFGAGHLGFHLAATGESIGLYRADGSLSDSVEFEAQAPDLSAARIPDGSDEWVITDEPTPGESNGQ